MSNEEEEGYLRRAGEQDPRLAAETRLPIGECCLAGRLRGHEKQREEPTGAPELSWESLLPSMCQSFL